MADRHVSCGQAARRLCLISYRAHESWTATPTCFRTFTPFPPSLLHLPFRALQVAAIPASLRDLPWEEFRPRSGLPASRRGVN